MNMKYIFIIVLLFGLLVPDVASSNPYLVKVDFAKAKLHLFNESKEEIAVFSVALPKETPYLPQKGLVKKVEKNPYWAPTKATRVAYLEKNGQELPKLVKSGDPRNAMGKVKIYIVWKGKNADQSIRIHGTKILKSIGKRVSRGCIRMRNKDIKKLAKFIKNKKVFVEFS